MCIAAIGAPLGAHLEELLLAFAERTATDAFLAFNVEPDESRDELRQVGSGHFDLRVGRHEPPWKVAIAPRFLASARLEGSAAHLPKMKLAYALRRGTRALEDDSSALPRQSPHLSYGRHAPHPA